MLTSILLIKLLKREKRVYPNTVSQFCPLADYESHDSTLQSPYGYKHALVRSGY